MENAPAWRNDGKPFYEVWYWKFNLPGSPKAVWLRLTLLISRGSTEQAVAEAWGIVFDTQSATRHVAVKNTFPIGEFSFHEDEVRVGPSAFGVGRTRGLIRSNGSEIIWDLKFESLTGAFFHVPRWISVFKVNRSTVLTPYPNLLFSGTLTVNGTSYPVTRAPGMQGHIYGTKQAEEWAWAHANASDDGTPFVFELLTARIKLAGLLRSPPISVMFLEHRGRRYELKSLRESRSIISNGSLEKWSFRGESQGVEIHGEITTQISDFAGVRYQDTDGSFLYCHNSKVSTLRLQLSGKGYDGPCLITTSHCAFERVIRTPDSRVRFMV